MTNETGLPSSELCRNEGATHAAAAPRSELDGGPRARDGDATGASGNARAPTSIRLTILGEPASKANQRKLVSFAGKPALIKSDKALAYEDSAVRQIPSWARVQLEGPVRVTATLYYATERPDLDESIVLDVLQDRWLKEKKDKEGNVVRPRTLLAKGVYRNDRQVRSKRIDHAIDARNPRAEILIEPMLAQQDKLL